MMHIPFLCLLLLPLSAGRWIQARQNSGQFSLWAASSDASIDGRTVAENTSTDDGPTDIILAAAGSTTMQILGFLLDQSTPPSPSLTSFLVNEPERNGGSEYDGWVVGSANAAGVVAPQVVPAGASTGWSLVPETTANGTAVQELAFEAGGKNATFYVCNDTLSGTVKQQLFFAFDTAPSGCCQIQLVAQF